MKDELFDGEDALLGAEEVAEYLGVGPVTIYRWCRDGRLPCMKIGKSWRIRRGSLEEFLRRSEQSSTLTGRLRSFLEVPDNVLAIAEDPEVLHRLDAAFFQVGEARGGTLIKYHAGDSDLDELRADLQRYGFETRSLEAAGRLRFIKESDLAGRRPEELRNLLDGEVGGGAIWADFNWEQRIGVEEALEQQRALADVIQSTSLVVKTSVLEEVLDEWPPAAQRKAQALHSGTVWLSDAGLSLSRVTPVPED